MENWFLLVGMVCLWVIAVGVTLALMPDDEYEQDANQPAEGLKGKGQS